MLVLSRGENDGYIKFRDKHTGEVLGAVKVTRIQKNRARIGFDCPEHIEIYREEMGEFHGRPADTGIDLTDMDAADIASETEA